MKLLSLSLLKSQRSDKDGPGSNPSRKSQFEILKEKRVLLEPFYLMFNHDDQGQVRYFSIVEELEIVSNEVMERPIDQLSRSDKKN